MEPPLRASPHAPVRLAEMRRGARALLVVVAAATAATVAVLTPHLLDGVDGWAAFLLFAPLVAASQLFGVATPRGYTIVVTGAGLVALALLVPPELAVLAGLGPLLRHGRKGHAWPQTLFNVCNETLAVTAASAAAHAVLAGGSGGQRFALAGLAATAVFGVVNVGLLAAMLVAEGAVDGRELRTSAGEVVLPEATLSALGVVVAWLWVTNPVLVPFALLAVGLVFRALHVPRLEEEARLDAKTGLENPRAFREDLREELARARRFRRPLALVLADLDYLRDVNNTYGHLAGDAVILGIADVLRAELRRVDVAARFGGEEFAVLLPETSGEQAAEIAERIRRVVAARAFAAGDVEVRATISLGVAAFPDDALGADDLLRRADEALYAAKAAGRNRVRRAVPQGQPALR